MKRHFRSAWIGILALLAFAPVPGLLAAEPPTRPIQVESNLEAVIPSQLKSLLLENPSVRFLITVNEEGELIDYLAVHATHYGLLDRAEKRIQRTKFSPALVDGVPVQDSIEVRVPFFDPEQRAVSSGLVSLPFGDSSFDATRRWVTEAGKDRLEYSSSKQSEMDESLEVTSGKILVMTDSNGRPANGDCVVEFYVDHRGEVRLPRIVTSDSEAVSLSALLTVREMRFAPITRSGLPTFAKVRQPMSFQTSGSSTSKE